MRAKKNRNLTSRYASMQTIYRENYLEDISYRLSRKAIREKQNCS